MFMLLSIGTGFRGWEQFRSLAETVKGGVIDNCGHWVIEEQPGQLLEGLEEFLRQ
jgi:pimeloyl-ACP methyl ester carboxylesterase